VPKEKDSHPVVELKRLGWEEADLGRVRKGAPEKIKISLRLRRETTMTLAWIAQTLTNANEKSLISPSLLESEWRELRVLRTDPKPTR
jgi:hypothetical protein